MAYAWHISPQLLPTQISRISRATLLRDTKLFGGLHLVAETMADCQAESEVAGRQNIVAAARARKFMNLQLRDGSVHFFAAQPAREKSVK